MMMSCKWIAAATALLLVAAARPANATTISLGTRIPISISTFAVPIDIADAQAVIAWEFDLIYDPRDVLGLYTRRSRD
jgi:hypothetical protein